MSENALLISSLFLWGSVHSFLASLKIKEFIKKRFGNLASGYYRLAYNIIAVISFFPIIGLMAFLPDYKLYTIPMPWVAFTLIFQLSSSAVLAIGLKQTGTMEFLGLDVLVGVKDSEPHKLNKSGLYKFMRHPLYSAGLVLLWLSPVMTQNSLIVSSCLSIYIVIGVFIEERKLVFEYGDIYKDYRKQVPMFVPRLLWNKKEK